jgi:hypothetical protein
MPIETTCQTCGKLLRVGEEHAGKLAKCPACQTIYTVPPAGLPGGSTFTAQETSQNQLDTSRPALGTAEMDRWHLRTPEGMTFGPVPKAVLDQWQREGRIVAQSQVVQDGNSQWLSATAIYPQLLAAGVGNPFASSPSVSTNPYAPPQTGAYLASSSRFQEPHRGGLILTLGIISMFVCAAVGLVAIVMAIIDLNKMSSGRMDPGGRGLTIAGLVIASLQWLFLGGFIVLGIFAAVLEK